MQIRWPKTLEQVDSQLFRPQVLRGTQDEFNFLLELNAMGGRVSSAAQLQQGSDDHLLN